MPKIRHLFGSPIKTVTATAFAIAAYGTSATLSPMEGRISSEVEVRCPSCGNTGIARIASGSKRTTASVLGGFIVKLTPDNSIQIVCAECRTTAYQVE